MYLGHGQESANLNSVCKAVFTTLTIDKQAVEKLERTRQRLDLRSHPVAEKSEDTDNETAPVWAFVYAKSARAGSEGQGGLSNNMELRYWQN